MPEVWRIRRLPRYLRHWRCIADAGGSAFVRQRDVVLILSARKIPWRIFYSSGSGCVYVPALLEKLARDELVQYAIENQTPLPTAPVQLHSHWQLAPVYIVPLILLHGYFPPDSVQIGALSGSAVHIYGEWWRIGTALTVHADWGHVVSNAFFGSIFLCVLARLSGVGRAWLLTCLGGLSGNGLSVCIHSLAYRSIGFSTAVFASLGAAAGVYMGVRHGKIFLPLASALALLAVLGTEGVRTDYAAHLCGIFSGFILGLLSGTAQVHGLPVFPQWLAAVLAVLLPLFMWAWALH